MNVAVSTIEETRTRIINAFMEAFNHGNLSAFDAICAPNMVDHSITGTPNQPYQLEGFKGRVYQQRVGMPDLCFSITNTMIEGDMLAFQWEMRGTNTGTYLGRPGSGKPIRVVGMNLDRLENGKIVEHWSYPDKLALMQQLGAIPA
ncbi:MAG TPA: ester cyclase [Anaerolineales bacterium]|nr:ester cyclase [Anaerolineales bacterium]